MGRPTAKPYPPCPPASILVGEAFPVGVLEVSVLLGVTRQTAIMWRYQGFMPPPRWTVSGMPCWDWGVDIVPWAQRTGRLDKKPSA